MSTWHPAPPPPPQREWSKWHAGLVLERDTVLVAVMPTDAGMDYGQYVCNGCATEHLILPADDSGEIRYGQERSTR